MRKKIFYGVCMIGLIALVTTSCKKKEETTNSFRATHGTFQVVDVDGERAYLDPEVYLTMWDDGDAIKVFNFENGNQAVFQVEEEGGGANEAYFVNQDDDIGYASGYYAFYPAQMAGADFDGVYQKFVLDPIQYVRSLDAGSFSYTIQDISIPQAAYTTYEDNYYSFKLIFGIANFKMTCGPRNNQPRYVQKIVVKDNHFNLCGEVTLKPNKIDSTKLTDMINYLRAGDDVQYAQKWSEYVISHEGDGLGYSAIGGGKELTYDFSSMNDGKGVGLNSVDTRSLMVGLRPGAFAYGFTVDLYIYDCSDNQVKKITITKYNNENRLYAIRPGLITGFNIGSITTLVNNWTPGN